MNNISFPNNKTIHSSSEIEGREEEISILNTQVQRDIPLVVDENDGEKPNKTCKTSVQEEDTILKKEIWRMMVKK